MNRYVAILVLPTFLLSCGSGSNPFAPDVEVAPAEPDPAEAAVTIPAELSNDLGEMGTVSYNATTQTLTVRGLNLDEVPRTSRYRRRPALDRGGYRAFTAQDDALDRHVTAYVRQTNNERSVRAGIVVSGGPRNRYFSGGFYERDGPYDPPAVSGTSGLVTYAGNYVGLTNVGGSGEDLRAVPGGVPGSLRPSQSAEVTGRIILQADFADGSVEGNIYNRRLVDSNTPLPSIVLVVTDITDNGTFNGTQVEYEQSEFPGTNVINSDIGDYGGVFGGTDASGVGGVVYLEQFDGPNDPLGFEGEEEWGTFVLDQCGQPVDAALCDSVNP